MILEILLRNAPDTNNMEFFESYPWVYPLVSDSWPFRILPAYIYMQPQPLLLFHPMSIKILMPENN